MKTDTAQIDSIVDACGPERSALVGILQRIQRREGYLSKKTLAYLSKKLGLPLSRLFGLATFYRSFSLTPTGRHVVSVCVGTACHVRGSTAVLKKAQNCLCVNAGQTTGDMLFTLQTVNCLGSCALGPVVTVDNRYYGHMKGEKVPEVLQVYRDEPMENNQ